MHVVRSRPAGPPDAAALLELMEDLPVFSLAGFELSRRTIKVHLGTVPIDDRSGSAGLFGIYAPESWHGIGIKVGGTAHRLDADESPRGEERDDNASTAVSAIVLTREGELASFLDVDGQRTFDTRSDSGPPEGDRADGPYGSIIDSLHRILGLPAPGEAVPASSLVTALWLDDIVTILLREGSVGWTDAARIHPLAGHNPVVPPSTEMIVEATCRASEGLDWERLWHKALLRGEPSAGLTPEEVKWMDPTMFSRWTVASFPDMGDVVELMVEFDSADAALRLVGAIDEIRARQLLFPDDRFQGRTA